MTGMGVRIAHEASCPHDDPALCATEPYEPYVHDQRITWTRLDPTLAIGLGSGLQADLSVPVELRLLGVDYTDLDGAPIDAPSDIHHRDETIAGLGDGRYTVRAYARKDHWTFGGGVGTSLPLGGTVEDPFRLTAQGLDHQHMQLGSGTWDPIAVGDVVVQGARWGALASVSARWPWAENAHGYRGPRTADLSVGPTWRASPEVQLWLTADPSAASPERWNGTEHGGRLALLASGGVVGRVGSNVALQAQVRTTVAQASLARDDEGALVQRWIASVGVSVTPGTGVTAP